MKIESLKSKPIVICAQQRSGTSVFRQLLANAGYVTDLGEVFASGRVNDPPSFYFFLKNILKEDRNELLFKPSYENREKLATLYIEYLSTLAKADFFTIDLKYDVWHHLNTFFHQPTDPPFLLQFLRWSKIPIIHIVRLNLFQQVFSLEYGLKVNKWHYSSKERSQDKEDITLELEPSKIFEKMRDISLVRNLFRRWLSGNSHSCELIYEYMFHDNRLTQEAAILLKTVTNIDNLIELSKQELPFQKTPVNAKDVILNQKSITDYFKGTEFEYVVGESLK